MKKNLKQFVKSIIILKNNGKLKDLLKSKIVFNFKSKLKQKTLLKNKNYLKLKKV